MAAIYSIPVAWLCDGSAGAVDNVFDIISFVCDDYVSMRRFEGEFGVFFFANSVEILAKWGDIFPKSGTNCGKISGKFKIRGNFFKKNG